MGLYHRPGTVGFIDEEPVDIDALVPGYPGPRMPRLSEGLSVHAYADVHMERVDYGVALMRGGAKGDIVSTQEVGDQTYSDYHSPVMELKHALEYLGKGMKYAFEESGYVDVEDEVGYSKALELLEIPNPPSLPEDWDPRPPKRLGSMWTGPGLYDFRDKPPTKAYDTTEEYQIVNMELRADETIDMMFEGDDERLREKLEKLLKEAAE